MLYTVAIGHEFMVYLRETSSHWAIPLARVAHAWARALPLCQSQNEATQSLAL